MADKAQNWPQRWEDSYPTVLSFLILFLALVFLELNREWVKPVMAGVIKLVPAALNVSAIAVGFLATAETLLLSLTESKAPVALRRSCHHSRLLPFFARDIAASFTSALLSALLTAMRLDLGGLLRNTCVIIWAFSGFTALFCYCRASRMLSQILRINSHSAISGNNGDKNTRAHENDIEILEG